VVDGVLLELLEEPDEGCVPMFGHLWVVVDPEELEPEEPDPEELDPEELDPDEDVLVVEVDPVDPVVLADDVALVDVVAAVEVPVEPDVDEVVELVVDAPLLAVEPVAAFAATAPPRTRPAVSAPSPIALRTLCCIRLPFSGCRPCGRPHRLGGW
jgi:hypothetical protein